MGNLCSSDSVREGEQQPVPVLSAATKASWRLLHGYFVALIEARQSLDARGLCSHKTASVDRVLIDRLWPSVDANERPRLCMLYRVVHADNTELERGQLELSPDAKEGDVCMQIHTYNGPQSGGSHISPDFPTVLLKRARDAVASRIYEKAAETDSDSDGDE